VGYSRRLQPARLLRRRPLLLTYDPIHSLDTAGQPSPVGPPTPGRPEIGPAVSLTELTATSRVTVFPLEALTLAYTTQSSDQRGLGDIGLVAVVDVLSEGEELWRLARDLGGRSNDADQARWILAQASRARIVAAYTDLPYATWTAYIRRRFHLDALFANHDILLTGRIALASP